MEKGQTGSITKADKLPLWLKFVLLAIPVIIACIQVRILDNDFFFLYPTGEQIVKCGFPHTDFLSMHSDMKIVVQQWLSSVIFYFVYSIAGKYGIIALIYICYACICLILYRLILLISKNEMLSVLLTWLSGFLLFHYFMVSRPQIFTYIVLLTEVLLIEKSFQTKKKRYLIALPVLSVLLINLHAAMWPMLFVFMIPFLVSAALKNCKKADKYACGDLVPLLVSMAVSVPAGFLNPYGISNMLYMTSTSGQNNINEIYEMRATSAESPYGLLFFILLIAIGIITFFMKKHPFTVRYLLLFLGSLFISLMHFKGIPYFLLFGIPTLGYMFKDFHIVLPELKGLSKPKTVLASLLVLASFVFTCFQLHDFSCSVSEKKLLHYQQLDNVIEALNRSSEQVVLFANFDDSQYFECYGYPTFVDGRSELFLAKNNGEYDYFTEYCNFISGKIYYKDFIDKYSFNYLNISKKNDKAVYQQLLHDDNYVIIYESEDTVLFNRRS